MKKFSAIVLDSLIILFIGFSGGLVDIFIKYYKPDMVSIILHALITGVIIGCSIMLSAFLMRKKNTKFAFYKVIFTIICVNGIGIFTAALLFNDYDLLNLAAIFVITTFVSCYVISTKHKLKKKLNYSLEKKKMQIKSTKVIQKKSP